MAVNNELSKFYWMSVLGVFTVQFGLVLMQNVIDLNNKFYFGLVWFGLIIIEKSNQTKSI